MAAAPELVPFAYRIVLRRALWPFTALVAYLFLWGLLQALDGFVRACFGTAEGAVSWIPYLGRVVSSGLHSTEHKIGSIIGRYAAYFETQAGIRWHSLGQLVTQLAADVEAAALLDWTLAKRLSHFLTRAQIHLLLKGVHAVGKLVTHETTVIQHKVVRVEKIVGTKANAAVAHRVGALAGEVEHVIEWDLPRIRARERALTDEVGRLWHRVRGRAGTLGATALTAAVALALARLGGGWIRCRNWNRIGKRVCRTPPGEIDALLGLFATAAIVADFRQLVKLAQTVEHGVASALQDVAKL